MDNYFTGQRPFNPYLNQSYTAPYIGTITHVKGAEGCNAYKMGEQEELKEKNPCY